MAVEVRGVSKAFEHKQVLKDISAVFEDGKIYCLMGPSGQGKTTLLRMIAGLDQPDEGKVITGIPGELNTSVRFSGVFQEDRLCDAVDAVTNVAMVCRRKDGKNYARMHLLEILPKDSIYKPVSQLSGGMRRRVAIVRAMAAESDFVFMDEPFTGLDEETKKQVIQYILRMQKSRTLLVVTHQPQDVQMLGGQAVYLEA